MKNIAYAETLVDYILEQGFSVTVALSNLNGNSDVDWTDCYNGRCKVKTNDFDRKECKADCQWRSYNTLISRMNALRSRCTQTSNPSACINTIEKAVEATREKQRNVRTQIAQIRRDRAEFRRKETAR